MNLPTLFELIVLISMYVIPNILGRIPVTTYIYSLGGLSLCLGFYCYLEALYLVDEILEGDALRELSIEEKTTIILRQVICMLSTAKF